MRSGRRRYRVLVAAVITYLFVFALFAVNAFTGPGQQKEYGFDDTAAGGGKGEKFTDPESAAISGTLDKMAELDVIHLKDGSTVDPGKVVKDLREMLKDGRMGKGKGAKEKVNASTQRDKEATSAGDRMNISDHLLESATNEHLGDVLAHEWKHTTQTGGTDAEREAIAYQVGGAMYLTKGGGLDDDPLKNDTFQVKKFKEQVANALKKLPDNKTPKESSDHCDCAEGGGFYEYVEPSSKVFLWTNGQRRDSVAALPNRMFFSLHHLKSRGPLSWLLVTGTDTTNALAPVGIATLLQADATHFLSRTDVVLSQLRYPLAAASNTSRTRVYLLDSHASSPAVWIFQDITGDSIPDQILTPAFATITSTGVSQALGILPGTLTGFPEGVLISTRDLRGVDDVTLTDPVRLLVDLNADNRADQSIAAVYGQFTKFAPTIASDPHPGDTALEVFAMNGHTVQLRATDASGTVTLQVLGSQVVAGHDPVTMSLSRPLVAGEYVIAVDTTDNTSAAEPEQVLGAVPAAGAVALAIAALLTLALGATAVGAARRSSPSPPAAS